jgi:hypothetical protein
MATLEWRGRLISKTNCLRRKINKVTKFKFNSYGRYYQFYSGLTYKRL